MIFIQKTAIESENIKKAIENITRQSIKLKPLNLKWVLGKAKLL
ncbi:hypothetical protein BCK_21515 [Bacillus cereus FRI-35]|jgi:hypothetical protein|uniref:Uncharacterized protein n=2 Tax=Bacillus cereus group TaxID=86661 RepID=Q737F6_BACC1|nr:hypothetical protein BCE_2693 [Bacillus cereus ATCC 10987]AFQ12187.1 hypothetical protein BCK_21515 [Bacillus cereus FRI-35]AIE79641.1 Macrolide glycosyltransferase [Bacillus cereus]SME42729.1 hypothetical protein BACERE00191_05278 [Bacillus pacificus]